MDWVSVLPPLFAGILSLVLCFLIVKKPKDGKNKVTFKLLFWFFLVQTISSLATALYFGIGYTVEIVGNIPLYFIFTITYQIGYILMFVLACHLKYSSSILSELRFKLLNVVFFLIFVVNDFLIFGYTSVYTSFIGVVLEFILAIGSVYLLIKMRLRMVNRTAKLKSLILIIGIIFALVISNLLWYAYDPANLELLRYITIAVNISFMVGLILIFFSFTWKSTK